MYFANVYCQRYRTLITGPPFCLTMLLIGQRSFFELNILDYEYSVTSLSRPDRNLLWVAVRSGWQHHQSTSTAAIIHTYEIENLLGWLRHIYQTGRPQARLLFTEPCLSIECISAGTDEFLLQIKLAFEVAPNWHNDPFSPFWLPVVVSKSNMAEAIDQLEKQFTKFPIR